MIMDCIYFLNGKSGDQEVAGESAERARGDLRRAADEPSCFDGVMFLFCTIGLKATKQHCRSCKDLDSPVCTSTHTLI